MRGQFQRTPSGPVEKEMQARNCLPLFFLGFPAPETGFSLDTLSLGFRAANEAGVSH